MNKIRILVVEPNKEPYELIINHTLENMQKIVGGRIEFVELEDDVDLICNDEGKMNGLPLNRVIKNDIISGTFFISGQRGGDTISLNDKQIEKYKEVFKLEKHQVLIPYIIKTLKESNSFLEFDENGFKKDKL